jgi:hypothetical protein
MSANFRPQNIARRSVPGASAMDGAFARRADFFPPIRFETETNFQ